MEKQKFLEMAKKSVILLDGATGSNLTLAGMPKGVCTEQWILEHQDIFKKLQSSYAEAGSQIVYAPTFAANRLGLANFGLEQKVWDYNHYLVELSQQAVKERALVAGDLTTVGKQLEPQGELGYNELFEVYCQQIEALVDAGVDLLVAETMLSVNETAVALDAAQSVCDLPMMCTLTVESDGSAFFGGTAWEAVETLQELGAAAVGVNCSVGPDQLESVVANMAKIAKVPIIAKPNAGLPFINDKGEAIYSMNPQHFSACIQTLIAAGAGIVGGCCGTTPEYIKVLREMLGK